MPNRAPNRAPSFAPVCGSARRPVGPEYRETGAELLVVTTRALLLC